MQWRHVDCFRGCSNTPTHFVPEYFSIGWYQFSRHLKRRFKRFKKKQQKFRKHSQWLWQWLRDCAAKKWLQWNEEAFVGKAWFLWMFTWPRKIPSTMFFNRDCSFGSMFSIFPNGTFSKVKYSNDSVFSLILNDIWLANGSGTSTNSRCKGLTDVSLK